jgi:RND family efflux transporter MFP subunit
MDFLKKKKWLVAVLVLVIAGVSYYFYHKKKSNSGQIQYITATAEKGTLTNSVSASGNVVVDQSSNIDPTITGTVADLAVTIGDQVTKGQFLFNIVNNDLSVSVARSAASLAQAETSLESAKASKKQASSDYEKAKKDGAGKTAEDEEALKKKEEAAKLAVESAEKSLAAARADYSNTLSDAAKRRVTSPIDGTVNAVNIKNGDDLSKLSSGSSRSIPIIIGDLETLKTQVQVNEVDISSVKVDQKVMVKFDAIDGLETSGTVEKMDSLGTVDQGVVTYNVTIDFDTLDPRIKPEMTVTASIITSVDQNVLLVPASAVKSGSNGNAYVEVLLDGATTPEQKDVQVGLSNGTNTEIQSGISAGDKVVTQTVNPNATTSDSSSSSSNRGVGAGGFRAFGR